MLVLDPIVKINRGWKVLEVGYADLDVLVVGWDDPCIINQTSPVRFIIRIDLSVEYLDRNKFRSELVDGEVEWNRTVIIGSVNCCRTDGVATLVARHSESVEVFTSSGWA